MYINHTFMNDVTHLFKYILLNINVMVQFCSNTCRKYRGSNMNAPTLKGFKNAKIEIHYIN